MNKKISLKISLLSVAAIVVLSVSSIFAKETKNIFEAIRLKDLAEVKRHSENNDVNKVKSPMGTYPIFYACFNESSIDIIKFLVAKSDKETINSVTKGAFGVPAFVTSLDVICDKLCFVKGNDSKQYLIEVMELLLPKCSRGTIWKAAAKANSCKDLDTLKKLEELI